MDYIAELRSELIGLINETVDLDSFFPIDQIEKRNIRTLDFKEQEKLTKLRFTRNFSPLFMEALFADRDNPNWKERSHQWADLVEFIPCHLRATCVGHITRKNAKKVICYYDRRYAINEFVQQLTLHLYIHQEPVHLTYSCTFYMIIELIY